MKKIYFLKLFFPVLAILLWGFVATTIDDFFLPGSQPGQSGNIEHPSKCDNCHGGYDKSVEPAFNWRGSMMAQAARDPLYLACLAVANQDAPESGDLCIRCHAPDGWLSGRSTPTDGSALNSGDREGVQCDFCHKLVKPTPLGVNPYPNDADYTNGTYDSDQSYLATLSQIPPQSGNGMYIAHSSNAKRGPFVDAQAKHKMFYSPFHKEAELCATCHDVSNPAFKKVDDGSGNFRYVPNALGAPSESFITYDMFPVERTYSEWKMSSYNSPEGISSEVFGGNKQNVSTCQDCHMKDVSGYAANKRGIPYRHDLPLHDMTGGNTFVPGLVAQLYPDEVDQEALLAGVERAKYMLKNAASMEVEMSNDKTTATVTIVNETGHKLPSGYPEGRRIWVNFKAFNSSGDIVFESGAYDENTGVLNKEGAKIYEIELSMTDEVAAVAGEGYEANTESFHFVLNNQVLKDNRIPPRGFTNENFKAIQSPPVNYTYEDGQYWDTTVYTIPVEIASVIDHVNVRLLYQTVSKEYVEFLRDENTTNDAGQLIYNLWASNGKSAPVVMKEENIYFGAIPPPDDETEIPLTVSNLTVTRASAKGGRVNGVASLTVLDDNGTAVSGALVSGSFTGPTSKDVSGTTDANGYVEFSSQATKNPSTDWCFSITSIEKEGYTYVGDGAIVCEITTAAKMSIVSQEIVEEGLQIYPNAASEYTTINFSLKQIENVKVDIYNQAGVLVKTIVKEKMPRGENQLIWDTSQLPNGLYIVRLNYENKFKTKRVIIKQ